MLKKTDLKVDVENVIEAHDSKLADNSLAYRKNLINSDFDT